MRDIEKYLKELENEWEWDAKSGGPGGQDILKLIKALRMALAFKSTMQSINEHQGYTFSQPLINLEKKP